MNHILIVKLLLTALILGFFGFLMPTTGLLRRVCGVLILASIAALLLVLVWL